MDSQYWQHKWETGDILFHQSLVHPYLIKHFSEVSHRKVMVPLCGKSKDMFWLYSQGHEVVGIELSPIACQSFFIENQIPFEKQTFDEWTLFRSDRIAIWCGDFFRVPQKAWEGCTSIYDRAALIALPLELRRAYAHHLIQNWAIHAPQGSSMLLITVNYVSEKLMGPPFPVLEKEIRTLYEATFKVEHRDSRRDEFLSNRPPKFSNIEVTEHCYKLSVK